MIKATIALTAYPMVASLRCQLGQAKGQNLDSCGAVLSWAEDRMAEGNLTVRVRGEASRGWGRGRGGRDKKLKSD